jgi:HPr kinase/phosphorylase
MYRRHNGELALVEVERQRRCSTRAPLETHSRLESPEMPPVPGVSVGVLLRSGTETFGLPLELLAGSDGLTRSITSPHIQKTGLALAGFHQYLKAGRVWILAESEVGYLESLAPAARIAALRLALTDDLPCVVITSGSAPPAELVVEAERARLPLLRTTLATPTAIAKLTSILEDSLADALGFSLWGRAASARASARSI